ncbi:MAG: ribonuclease D [Steroidobacteraceae bacterium]
MTAIITQADALGELCERLSGCERIALDTEFMRERTYRPQLCLVQLHAPALAAPALVDPLALASLEPLAQLLQATAVRKVLHAARQDLEALWPLAKPVRAVFDTQLAAALGGAPPQAGYATLVEQYLGLRLAKAHTRTDWASRPLREEQLHYAAEDVLHLLPLADALLERLQRLGRLPWLDEELETAHAGLDIVQDPDEAWRRIKGLGSLDPDRRRLAIRLAAWREREADERNRPRNWILDDAVLRAIITDPPRTAADVMALQGLGERHAGKLAPALLEIIAASALPAKLPPTPRSARPDAAFTQLVKRYAQVVRDIAAQQELAPELLATRRDLERLAQGDRDIAALRGWRAGLLGNALAAAG